MATTVAAPGSYNPPEKPADGKTGDVIQKSGKYDSLMSKDDRRENPYVTAPTESSAYEMGAEAKARRDMYTLLPSTEELQKLQEN
jgi:hypothetical protein